MPSQLQALNGFLYLLLFQESLKDSQCLLGSLFGMGNRYENCLELGRSQMDTMFQHIVEVTCKLLCVRSFCVFIIFHILIGEIDTSQRSDMVDFPWFSVLYHQIYHTFIQLFSHLAHMSI